MQFTIRWRYGSVFEIELLDERPGFIVFKASGKKALDIFKREAGGHRWQRIPPTEKRGRVHTSTITVAVLTDTAPKEVNIDPKDLDWKFSRGKGKGGQHKNKTDTCVDLVHVPTGISVRVDGRSQDTNKETALKILRVRIKQRNANKFFDNRNKTRKEQVGSGMRGDKIRTIRVRDDVVTDHKSGAKISYKKYSRGDFSDLG